MKWIEEIKNITAKGESQFEEEAIIAHIFKYISTTNKFLVDLGAGAYGDSTMSNTRKMMHEGWSGYGVDAKETKDAYIIQEFITPQNILDIMSKQITPSKFDFLNLDIDSSDFWVLEKILSRYSPRVICTEFNGTLPSDMSMVLEYRCGYTWGETNKYGYSFMAGKKLLEKNGYEIIYNLHETNIFAVRKELVEGYVSNVKAIQTHYHPVNPNAVWIKY